jgi:ubiquinone/menaquinone biosynthesis C-methylase UbiE
MKDQQHYIHALRYSWLNTFYDSVVMFTTRDNQVKNEVVDAIPEDAEHVLDVAAGTGTLSRKIGKAYPRAQVVGVDGDADMVRRARVMAAKDNVNIRYDEALAQALPYANDAFDVVTSSLFFHHLGQNEKRLALAEMYRVTKPGGTLIISDWGEPEDRLSRFRFLIVQCLDGFETTRDNIEGLLPGLVVDAGFTEVSIIRNTSTPLGTISLMKGSK